MRSLLLIAFCTGLAATGPLHAQEAFRDIDHHADTAPPDVEGSIPSLARYLTGPARNDTEKARAIFRWVTSNIAYDWEGYKTSNYSDIRPAAVLRNKRAVCDGYAGLVVELGRHAGLEVVKVQGYAKGYAYAPGESFAGSSPNHAWNAVNIDGSWQLMDPTWGAGYVHSDEDRFVHRFEKHYFLTPPDLFIYDHYPLEERWQLLGTPVSLKGYEELPYIRPAAFATGLRDENRTTGIFRTDGELTLTFSGPDTLLLHAQLFEGGYGEHERNWAFIQRDDTTYRIRVHFPYDFFYYLRLYVQTEAGSKKLQWAAEYVIECTEDRPDLKDFPAQYPSYFSLNCRLDSPMDGVLKAGTTASFSLSVPGAESVAVVADSAWTYLREAEGVFTGEVPLRGAGTATLYAKEAGAATYRGILGYEITD